MIYAIHDDGRRDSRCVTRMRGLHPNQLRFDLLFREQARLNYLAKFLFLVVHEYLPTLSSLSLLASKVCLIVAAFLSHFFLLLGVTDFDANRVFCVVAMLISEKSFICLMNTFLRIRIGATQSGELGRGMVSGGISS